ncbi:Ig-like domain-containing protein [Tellurirhabdus bombi]|uniref:Ig-like domain-containing protein n=1 Tax=Tellurirhabdus bombi TaxID=2907205 RepID=UPI001F490BE7|nr:Ig-like domain-containing protein [Tellurirhabdus bombi]
MLAQAQTPLAANGRLKVVNRQLTNESGKAIQLRGMSSHGLQWFDQCYTQASVQALATDWGIDLFRAAMYVDEGGYLNNQSGLRAKINQIVDWTEQAGVYCIIDWHVLNPGNPNERLSYAIDFFRTMAQTHANKKHVIYEICNEPNGVSWSQIKSYAEQVIPVIRQYAPDAIILVGTPNWCQRPQDVLPDPLTGANAHNIMYTFHYYAASHFFQNDIRSVVNSLPLFCSEWGTSTYSGGGSLDFNNGQNWLDLMAGQNPAGQKISWCNWTFSDAGESSAGLNSGACNAQQWNNTSPSGTWVKQKILNPADDFGPVVPSVAITSPTHNSTVAIGTNLIINANVSNATATKVEFYNGATKLGEDATAPYSWTISAIQQGTYTLTVKALRSSGEPLTSSVVQVTAAPAPNQLPTVSLTVPANNSSFPLPATINLAANANDSDGSIVKVEFYNGNTKLGEDLTAPYTFAWSGMAAGTYALTAKAYDNQNAVTTSGSITVIVYNAGDPDPTADLIGPNCVFANTTQVFEVNASKLANATNFSWWCTGSTQSVTAIQPGKVSINFGPHFTGGQVCVGINYSAAPWYTQYCKTVTVCPGTPTTPTNQAPSVSLTTPVNNATYTAPATVALAANASDSDGSIAKVEFYNGNTKLGEDLTAPYQFSWTSVGVGSYSLKAIATDNSGATATSALVNITVNAPAPVNQAPTVSLTSPTNSATFTAPATVNLAANASDSDGSIAKVEFYNGNTKLGEATAAPYQFSWSSVGTGSYSLKAVATDNGGAKTESGTVTITVKTTTPPPTNPTADLIGPDCVSKNAVQTFELNASKLTNATNFSWWCTGSTQSITAVQPGKASINFGPWFTGGQVCVGVNYSAAPWYAQYCKSIAVCGSARVGISAEERSGTGVVFPSPSSESFTFVAPKEVKQLTVNDLSGREWLRFGAQASGQRLTFGERLSPDTYLIQIQYTDKTQQVIKVLKVGR